VAAPKSKQPFEELYKELEVKVALLEQGGLSLDDSLSTYEDAVALAQRCQELLTNAEQRITRLKESIAVSEPPSIYEAIEDEGEEAP
jgi:exodeoxyribonuclease VII small subunit